MSTGQEETFVEKMRRDREENAELYQALDAEPEDIQDVKDFGYGG
jgi:hypothetical protein